MDREKVIRHIKAEIEIAKICKKDFASVDIDMLSDAYELLLKELEAVEPTLIREGRNKNYNDYVCPRCDHDVFYEQNYCLECGVRFLWEDR